MSHEMKFVSPWWLLFEIFLNGIFNKTCGRALFTVCLQNKCSLDCITQSTCETDRNAPFHTSVFEITMYMYFLQFWNIFMAFVRACNFPWPNITWLIKSRRMRRACVWHAKERCIQSFVGQHKQTASIVWRIILKWVITKMSESSLDSSA